MNREQARNIIVQTFENPFNKNNFIHLLKNLLKFFEEKTFVYQGNYIPDPFEQYISSLERIGKYICNEKKIDLLIVHLIRGTSLERARTMQRNFIASYLKGSRGGKLKDASLVAFVSPDNEDWRFSLVKMDYRFEETPSGKVKVKEEFTQARRWSFLVGRNEKSHTAQSRFVPILEKDDHKPSLEDLEQAFSVEVVTKEFFQKYRDLFIRTKLELDRIVQNDAIVKQEFENQNINTVDFAKKLLGQIVFLYFLQKKGWFGVEKGKPWGTGPKDFIRRLFNKEFGEYQNFFNDILEPLFYEALRTDRTYSDHYYSRFNCKLPFLNGGLFDPINNYNWVDTEILIPNELFSNTNTTKEGDIGDGILDVFDRYNFTVNEEEPLEKEVALDPELLGKIYEKLNAIRQDNFVEYREVLKSNKKGEETKFNKEYGVYYTPREIVHYMCQESLKNYLCSTYIPTDDIEKFIKFADSIQEIEQTAIGKQDQIERGEIKSTKYESQIPDNIRNNAEKIDNLLADIKVCDPAVGSGAFPIGMMHEIVKLRKLLSVYFGQDVKTYDFKRHCIENSLYGVDIDAGAVEICKLRFWLSMIVDEEDFHNIKPLPNLDYKVVCGNSLLRIEKDLFNQQAFAKLEQLKPQYFNETNPTKKQQLKDEIEKLIYEITKGHKEFDFEVYFSEVFHKKGGFDIVIGNPPHGADLSKYIKYILPSFNFYDTKKNSASFFIEIATKFAKNGAIVAYIIPKSLTFVEGWNKPRNFICDKCMLIVTLDISKSFESVLLEQVVVMYKKIDAPQDYQIKAGCGWNRTINILGEVNKKFIRTLDIIPCYLDYSKLSVLNKIQTGTLPLSTISNTFRGLPWQRKISNNGIPILKGKNIAKYCIKDKSSKVRIIEQDYKLKKFLELQQPKIVSQNIVAHVMNPYDRIIIMATLDKRGLLTLDTCMNTILTNKRFTYEYILGILNSTLASWFYYWFVYNRAVRTMHFDEYYMGKIPIPTITLTNQPIVAQIESLVDQILAITKDEDYLKNPAKQAQVREYERQIDQLVYKLYGLNEDEIKIIEGAK